MGIGTALRIRDMEYTCEMNRLLFEDETAFIPNSAEKLSRLLFEFGKVRQRRKLKVNSGKIKLKRYRNSKGKGTAQR